MVKHRHEPIPSERSPTSPITNAMRRWQRNDANAKADRPAQEIRYEPTVFAKQPTWPGATQCWGEWYYHYDGIKGHREIGVREIDGGRAVLLSGEGDDPRTRSVLKPYCTNIPKK